MLQNVNFWLKKLIKEWLFLTSSVGVFATSLYLRKIPHYSLGDFKVLITIFLFLVVLKGLERSNVFYFLASLAGKGKFVYFKLVFSTAFISMFVTNDIALLMMVPLTLVMDIKHKDIIVIFEAIAANAGSALLPSGNPQNMFIYWFYNLKLSDFVGHIYYFSLISMLILFLFLLFIKPSSSSEIKTKSVEGHYAAYMALLVVMLGVVLKLIPIYFGAFVLLYVVIFDRKSLKVDYFLLGIFFMFFGFTDNLQHLIHIFVHTKEGVFISSAIISQFISNVPAALLISDFTDKWQSLLWGVSVGGYGNLIGSLANLIAYRIYVTKVKDSNTFLFKFIAVGYVFFFFMFAVYLFILKT